MFLEFQSEGPPSEPEPPRPRLGPREQRVLGWILAFNALLLLIAPIAGVTLFDAFLGR